MSKTDGLLVVSNIWLAAGMATNGATSAICLAIGVVWLAMAIAS